MFQRTALAAPALLLAAACSAGSGAPSHTETPGVANTAPASPAAEPSARCPTDGAFGLSFEATGLDALEGRTVWALVLAGHAGDQPAPVLVRLQGVVSGGAIALRCPHGIPANLSNVVTTIVADVDGTPGCSPGDRLLDWSTLFAINADQQLRLHDDQLAPVQPTRAWIESRPTIASEAPGEQARICDYITR